MSCSATIGNWATGMWQLLGSPPAVSALTLSGYATTPNTVGTLNTLISTCYAGSGFAGAGTYDYDVTPCYGNQELAIIGDLYLITYYNNLAQMTMGAGGFGVGGLPVQSLADGDTRIAYQSAAAIGAVYANLAKQAVADMRLLVNTYINDVQGGNTPRSVAFGNTCYPNWSFSFNGLGP